MPKSVEPNERILAALVTEYKEYAKIQSDAEETKKMVGAEILAMREALGYKPDQEFLTPSATPGKMYKLVLNKGRLVEKIDAFLLTKAGVTSAVIAACTTSNKDDLKPYIEVREVNEKE